MARIKETIEWLKIYGLAAVLIVVGFFAAYQFVGPAPTRNILLATGGQDGAYYQFGKQYAQRFASDNVELGVLETAGSVDNLARLAAQKHGVHAALIQGGVGQPEKHPGLESLGSLYYEPLWLFHTRGITLDILGDLQGKRIALGPRGSGTHALATRLLAENKITPQTARFLEIGGQDGIDALVSGQADALFVVAGTQSKVVREMLTNAQIGIYSFRRADAYARNFKFLSRVTLPRGSFDLHADIPDRDITLVAPGANLVIRNDLHPALIYLFMMAAEKTHHEGGLLEPRGTFPNPRSVDFPLNKVARRYYQSGAPFLMRVLPFWLATWLVRMFIMIIPLVTILYPLMKIAPPTYTWRIRRKVFKLYKELYKLEMDAARIDAPQAYSELIKRLDGLQDEAASLNVPASYMASQYHLRRNIDWMRTRFQEAMDAPADQDQLPRRAS